MMFMLIFLISLLIFGILGFLWYRSERSIYRKITLYLAVYILLIFFWDNASFVMMGIWPLVLPGIVICGTLFAYYNFRIIHICNYREKGINIQLISSSVMIVFLLFAPILSRVFSEYVHSGKIILYLHTGYQMFEFVVFGFIPIIIGLILAYIKIKRNTSIYDKLI